MTATADDPRRQRIDAIRAGLEALTLREEEARGGIDVTLDRIERLIRVESGDIERGGVESGGVETQGVESGAVKAGDVRAGDVQAGEVTLSDPALDPAHEPTERAPAQSLARAAVAVTAGTGRAPRKPLGRTAEAPSVVASTVEDGLRSTALKLAALLPPDRRVAAAAEARSLPVSSLAVLLPELAASVVDVCTAARRTGRRTGRFTSHVLAQVSREIRDPLMGILAAMRQLSGTDLGYDQRRMLDAAGLGAAAMQHLVNDLLDLASLQGGTYAPETLPFRLRDCISATLAAQVPRAQELRVQLTEDCAASIPDDLVGDPGRLRQVLGTLVGNALVSSRGGHLHVSTRLRDRDEGADKITLHFVIETRATSGARRRHMTDSGSVWRGGGATGLGLSISRRLVERMGGRTWVEATPEGGSGLHFTVEMGVQPTPPGHRERITGLDVGGLPLLVVDGAPESTPELMNRLRAMGSQPKMVQTAEEARGLLESAVDAGTPFRFVLLCASLSNRRAVAMAEAIGALPSELRPPVLLLTPTGQRGDSSRARRLGISAYLTLPLNAQDLRDALDVLSDPSVAETLRRDTLVTRHFLREARKLAPVLLVAGGEDTRAWLAEEIGALGHRVEDCDLDRALELADEGLAPPAFVVVFFDRHVDGPRLRALLGKLARKAPRPAVVGIVDAEAELPVDAGLDLAEARLEVPLEVDELRRAVGRMTRARLHAVQGLARLGGPALVDRRLLTQRLGEDRALEVEVIGLFQRDAGPMLRRVREAALAGDSEEIARAAHVLQGALAVFGVRSADDLCDRIGLAARRGSAEEAIRWLNRLEAVVASMRDELVALDGGGGR